MSPFSQDPPGTIYAGGFDAGAMRHRQACTILRGSTGRTDALATV